MDRALAAGRDPGHGVEIPVEQAPLPSSARMAAGASLTLIGQLCFMALRFANAPLAASLLGPAGFGLYRLAVTISSIALVIASGGIPNTLLSLIPRRRARDPRLAAEVLRNATLYGLAVSLAIVLAVLAGSPRLARLLGQPGAAPFLMVVMLSLPFAVMIVSTHAAARASFAFPAAVIPTDFVRPGILVVLLAGALLWRPGHALLVPWIYVGSYLAAAVVAVAMVMRLPDFHPARLRAGPWRDRELLMVSAPFLLIAMLQVLNESTMIVLLGRLSSAAAVGLYAAAERTAFLTASVLVSANMVFAPAISTLWVHRDHARLAALFRRATLWTMALTLPLGLVLVFAAPGLMRIFGRDYVSAAPALVWLALGQVVNAGTGAVGYLLVLTGHRRTMVLNTAATLAASVAVGGALIPRLGVAGAGAATACTMAGLNLVMVYQVWARLGLFAYDGRALRVLGAGLAAAGTGGLLYRWAWSGTVPWPAALPIIAATIAVTYLAGLLLLRVPEEPLVLLQRLRGLLPRR